MILDEKKIRNELSHLLFFSVIFDAPVNLLLIRATLYNLPLITDSTRG